MATISTAIGEGLRKAAEDGNLVVLRADAGGQVRVLFPIDPDGDQQVRGGKKYELKGRGGREASW